MAGDKRSVSWTRAALAVAGIVVLLWVLATGRPPRSTMLLHEIYNLGHIPLFGLIALLALSASRALFRLFRLCRSRHRDAASRSRLPPTDSGKSMVAA